MPQIFRESTSFKYSFICSHKYTDITLTCSLVNCLLAIYHILSTFCQTYSLKGSAEVKEQTDQKQQEHDGKTESVIEASERSPGR